MKFPSVYPLTIPSSHRMIRMIAIVSSIDVLLRAKRRPARQRRILGSAPVSSFSNGCATRRRIARRPTVLVVLVALAGLCGVAPTAGAQDTQLEQKPSNEQRGASIASLLLGGAVGLGAHEAAHLVFDGIFDAHPGISRVSFHGIPFFAITHDAGLSPRQEFVIDAAGFWA